MDNSENYFSYYLTHWRVDIWLQFFLFTMVLFIAVIGFIRVRRYLKLYEENSTFEVINNLYSHFHQLTNIQNDWCLSHLLCISNNEYAVAWEKINAASKQLTDTQLAELYFKERNMAVNILVFYEQVYYQLIHSKNFTKRRRFLSNLNDYFLDRLLFQNPRLAYYVISNPGGIKIHLEEESYRTVLARFSEKIELLSSSNDGSTQIQENSLFRYDNEGPFVKNINKPDFKIIRKQDEFIRVVNELKE